MQENLIICSDCSKKIQGDWNGNLMRLQKYNLEKVGYTLMFCSKKCANNFKKEHPDFKISKEVEEYNNTFWLENEKHPF